MAKRVFQVLDHCAIYALIAGTYTPITLCAIRPINTTVGWGVILVLPVAIKALTWDGFMYILAGGIFYTIGAILYGIGRNKSYMHCIFHVFVLLGSIAHLLGIIFYVL